jgi:hypothetical protein
VYRFNSFFIEETIPTLLPEVFVEKSFNENIQMKGNENFAFEDEEFIMIIIRIFLPSITYDVTSSLLHSTGSEDTVFDPGIFVFRAGCPFQMLPQD